MGNEILSDKATRLQCSRCPYCNNYQWTPALLRGERYAEHCGFCGSVFTLALSINSKIEILK
jgi:hypothetical protein